MASLIERGAAARPRRPPGSPSVGQLLLYLVCYTLVVLSLLSWSTFGVSPAHASLRYIGNSTRARFAAFLQRFRHRTPRLPPSSPALRRPNRSSTPLQDIPEAGEEVSLGPESEGGTERGATAAVPSVSGGQSEIAIKAKLALRKMHTREQSPLHKLLPEKEPLIFRFKSENLQYDFMELRQRRFLGTAHHSLMYMVAADRDKYLLRILCAPSPKSTSANTEQLHKLITFEMEASIAVTKRLSGDVSTSELIQKGLGVPITSGKLLSIPHMYEAAGMICGSQAIVYHPMPYILQELLEKVQLSDAALLYLTREVVQCVAEMHRRQLTHNNMSTASFRLDEKGNVFIFPEFDHAYRGWGERCGSDEPSAATSASGYGGLAASSAHGADVGSGDIFSSSGNLGVRRPSSSGLQKSGKSESSWAINESSLRQLPGTSSDGTIVHGGSITSMAGSQVVVRPKKRQKDARHLFCEQKDAYDLADVVYTIWCGPEEEKKGSGSRIRKSRTLTAKPLSFKNCKGNPPHEVKALIRKLQSTRASYASLPTAIVSTSPLFQEHSSRDSTSSTGA